MIYKIVLLFKGIIVRLQTRHNTFDKRKLKLAFRNDFSSMDKTGKDMNSIIIDVFFVVPE